MKKIIVYLAICGSLFGAGLGLALFLEPKNADETSKKESPPEIFEVVPSDPEADLLQLNSEEGGSGLRLPIAVRGKPLSAEELFRFGEMYREQQESLDKRTAEIETRGARLKLIHDDLAGSRKEFDGLRSQVRELSNRGEQEILRLQEQRQELERMRMPVENGPTAENTPDENANKAADILSVKKIASWLEGMPSEKAAEYIEELSSEGKQDAAVELLVQIEERDVAKILAAIDNPAVVVELTESFRNVKRRNVAGRIPIRR